MRAAVDERSCVEVTEMNDPESRTIFAGVDGRTDTELSLSSLDLPAIERIQA